jgi:hypothetical protein
MKSIIAIADIASVFHFILVASFLSSFLLRRLFRCALLAALTLPAIVFRTTL